MVFFYEYTYYREMNRFWLLPLLLMFVATLPKDAMAFSCFYEYSPFSEARYLSESDVVLKGKVVAIEHPSLWTQYFSDYVFDAAIIEPVEVYKGTASGELRIVESVHMQGKNKRQTASLGKPKFPSLNVGQTYTFALKYDENYGAYVKEEACLRFPEFRFLSTLKELQKIDGLPENSEDPLLPQFQKCSMYFADNEMTSRYFTDVLSKNYTATAFEPPIHLISKDGESKHPIQKIYTKLEKNTFSAVWKI
ncbi:MAG: hypothetical protein LRY62_01375 [Alphaproteobacteria bacterium]|nr:hypothetical protein [Alphaproteobacteria bacterium]